MASSLHVAIIGGGITGLHLAVGLQTRGIDFTVYERTSAFRELGAGIGLSPNAERAMKLVGPGVHDAFKAAAMPNGEDYFQWINGVTDELMFKLYMGEDGFQGCRRSDYLDELVKLVSPERLKLNMELEDIKEKDDEGRVHIVFKDGTIAKADVVLGCDGIHSIVRQVMLGKENKCAYAGYTGKFCFRALVPMDVAVSALGKYRPSTRFMYNGPNAHIITYPVAAGSMLNVLLVIGDANPWTEPKHTARGSKKEAAEAFKDFHPTCQTIVDLFPDELDKWAIFDMLEHPTPAYNMGSVCLAGDAAHATGPHLGSGAGFGIEDALVLASVLAVVAGEKNEGSKKQEAVHRALEVYNDMRYERTQWLVKHTRDAVDLFEWEEGMGKDGEDFGREITWRFHTIWEKDVARMAEEASSRCQHG